MSTLVEWLGQAALVLVAWTVVSVLAVWPIVWWMRGQAAVNEASTPLAASQPTGVAAATGSLPRQLDAGGASGR